MKKDSEVLQSMIVYYYTNNLYNWVGYTASEYQSNVINNYDQKKIWTGLGSLKNSSEIEK